MEDSPIKDLRSSMGNDDSVIKNRKKKRKKKRKKIIIFSLLGIFLIILYFILDVTFRVSGMISDIHVPLETEQLRDDGFELGQDPFSVLILGIEGGRSDTMMLATVNPDKDSTYLLSIARDTKVYIVGNGSTTRINHAFAYGGATMSINTIQRFLDVPIDFYVELDMDGFGPLVDAIGGVTVNNDLAFSEEGHYFPFGEISLNGEQALAFVRMRMQDPQGDFGRQQRQRDVTEAMIREMAGVSVVTRYQNILNAVGDNMFTDLALGEIIAISTGYTSALGNITNLDLRGNGQMINGMALQVVPEEERLAMSSLLRTHLGLE